MNDKNIEDFQRWSLLCNEEQREIMNRLRNPKLSSSHLGCQNCDSLTQVLTRYKNELNSLITHVLEHLEYNSNDESSKQTIVRLCNVIKKQLLNNK